MFSGAMLVGVIGWTSSPYLRERTTQIWSDLKQYEVAGDAHIVRRTARVLAYFQSGFGFEAVCSAVAL